MGDRIMPSIIRATTTSGLQVAPDNSGSLELQTNGTTTAVTIDTSQNVGIGTTSPSEKLVVNGNISQTNSGYIVQTNGTNTVYWSLNPFNISNSFGVGTAQSIPFIVGNANTERMRIDSSGNLMVGATSPYSATTDVLTVTRAQNNITQLLVDNQDAGSSAQTRLALEASGGGWYIANQRTNNPLVISNTAGERMRITSGGEVYVAGTTDRGAFNLQCNGTGVWGAGAYTNGSDERIKENITPIDSGLDVVAKLNPVTYKYKEDWSKDQSTQTGFIAQDLLVALEGKNYVDGIVNQSSEYMSVAYQNITPILTKAIQEQQTIINDLKARIEALEAK
jgi:hypothetical protein